METTMRAPEAREPRPAADEPALTGKRVVWLCNDDGLERHVRDYRASSEVFEDGGRAYVRIVPELDWYAWSTSPDPDKPPSCPRAKAWPAEFVWVEG